MVPPRCSPLCPARFGGGFKWVLYFFRGVGGGGGRWGFGGPSVGTVAAGRRRGDAAGAIKMCLCVTRMCDLRCPCVPTSASPLSCVSPSIRVCVSPKSVPLGRVPLGVQVSMRVLEGSCVPTGSHVPLPTSTRHQMWLWVSVCPWDVSPGVTLSLGRVSQDVCVPPKCTSPSGMSSSVCMSLGCVLRCPCVPLSLCHLNCVLSGVLCPQDVCPQASMCPP